MAAKIPDFDNYYHEDGYFLRIMTQHVYYFTNTIPRNAQHNFINMTVELKIAAKNKMASKY